MKRLLAIVALLGIHALAHAHVILQDNIKSLQVMVNGQWLTMPVMKLDSNDVLTLSFDELSHDYHRYRYNIRHCEPDFQPSTELFVSDYMEGFNGGYIEDCVESINTNQLYTHYTLRLPNDRCRIKMSGNYELTIVDEDNDDMPILIARFYVVEPLVSVTLGMSTNTDIDLNASHQQVSMNVDYGSLRVTNPSQQILTKVWQNGLCRQADCRINPKPDIVNNRGLQWTHNRKLIFDAGNEYRKFEILDTDHPSMGVNRITWDGDDFHAWLFTDAPRPNYLTDADADGAFLLRNSDNQEVDYTSDYMSVHFKLESPYSTVPPIIDGAWTMDNDNGAYTMQWDEEQQSWTAVVPLKLGYYSYRYVVPTGDGYGQLPSEGNYYQTENRYEAMVYYKGTGARTWQLVGYHCIVADGSR